MSRISSEVTEELSISSEEEEEELFISSVFEEQEEELFISSFFEELFLERRLGYLERHLERHLERLDLERLDLHLRTHLERLERLFLDFFGDLDDLRAIFEISSLLDKPEKVLPFSCRISCN